eukprot:jgi/Bigna1/144420/aug1.87_g19128
MSIYKARADFAFKDDDDQDGILEMQIGDIITIIEEGDEGGWWRGKLNGVEGFFPITYCTILRDEEVVSRERVESTSIAAVSIVSPRDASGLGSFGESSRDPTIPDIKSSLLAKERKDGPPPLPAFHKHKISVLTDMSSLISRSRANSRNLEIKNKPAVYSTRSASNSQTRMYGGGPKTKKMGILGLDTRVKVPTQFNVWAKNMAIISSLYCIILGFCALIWGGVEESAIPYRGLMYFIVGFPLFIAYPTIIAGVKPKKRKTMAKAAPVKPTGDATDSKSRKYTNLTSLKAWLIYLQNTNKLGTKLQLWFMINDELDEEDRISGAGPFAKGLEMMELVFNFKYCLGKCLAPIVNLKPANVLSLWKFNVILQVTFIPVDKNIAFHKFIAYIMAGCAAGHMFFHFINYILRPDQTISLFGIVPWYTGGLIVVCIFVIFSGGQRKVRRKQFEIFWYTHIFVFPLFFILLLIHGKGGWNPNFWKWFIVPAVMYAAERIVTIRRTRKPVTLLSVTSMKPNVFSLEIEKSGPFEMKTNGREPYFEDCFSFSISSAPSDKTITFHIRKSIPGSWTDELHDYLLSLGNSKSGRVTFSRNNGAQRVSGKIIGPDGLPLLKIDGPHSAPTQHISKYKNVMVIGAGIGVTPVASASKSVVFHKWRTAVGEVFPNNGRFIFSYFYWVVSHRDVDSFRWLIRLIKDCQDEVSHQRSKAASVYQHKFEFHIFVTSAKNPKPVKLHIAKEDELSFWGARTEEGGIAKAKGPFDESTLYSALKCPIFGEVKQLGNVYVHNGRPNWRAEFARVKAYHPESTVGVAFCGNEHIAKDLKRQSAAFSNVEQNSLFRLHLENF